MSGEKLFLIVIKQKNIWSSNSIKAALRAMSLAWWNYMPDVWIIKTHMDLNMVSNKLSEYFASSSDNYIIAEMDRFAPIAGKFPNEGWDWIQKEFGNDQQDVIIQNS